MLTHVVTILLAAAFVESMSPCCFPKKWSADVIHENQKMFTVYVDCDKKIAVEEWNGVQGTDYILYDMATSTSYQRNIGADCYIKKYANDHFKYTPCIPEDAEYRHQSKRRHGQPSNAGFRYSGGWQELVVKKGNCAPVKLTIFTHWGTDILYYKKMKLSLADPSILDKDISDCQ